MDFWIYAFEEEKDNLLRNTNDLENIQQTVFPKLTKQQQIFYERMKKSSDYGNVFLKKENINDWIVINNSMAFVICKQFTQRLKNKLKYKVTAEAYSERIEKGNQDDYLLKYKNVYSVVARIKGVWGHFNFTVVEESGSMKIASVWIADN